MNDRSCWRITSVWKRRGLDPEAELTDLDGLGVQVHAVGVVLDDLPVQLEEGALAAQFLQPGVGESDVQAGVGPIMNCSLSFWKRLRTASGTLPSTSTCRSREKVKVSGDSAGPVLERWELWELWEL